MKDHRHTGAGALTPGAFSSKSLVKPGCVCFRGLLLAVLFAPVLPSLAATITWTNVNGGLWSDATCWSPNQVPGASDDVLVTVSGTYQVALDVTTTINSLTLGGAAGRQTVTNAGFPTLTLNNPSVVQTNGVLGWSRGTIAPAVLLRINGTLSWSGGNLHGVATVGTNGQILLSGSSGPSLAGALTNYGTVTWQTSAPGLAIGSPSGTPVYNFGLWDAQTDTSIGQPFGSTNTPFNNFGTFRKSGGSGATVLYGGVNFNNSGLVDVRSGTFELNDVGSGSGSFSNAPGTTIEYDNGYTFMSGSSLAGAGNFLLAGGPFALPTTILSSNVQMTGGSLVGPNVLNGRLAWVGGSWRGASPMVIATNSVLVIGGASDHDLGNCIFTNFGTVTWNTSGGNLVCGQNNGTQIHNFGLWDAQTDQSISPAFNSLYVVFNNYGTFRKSAGAGSTVLAGGVNFTNSGLTDVRSGILELGDAGGSSSSFSNAPGTTIQYDNGYTFLSGSSLAGAGNFLLNGGPFNLPTTIISSNVQMMGGSLVGPNTLNGRLAWVGGSWRAAGPIVIATNSVLVIGGTLDHDLGNCIFTNFGTVTWNTSGGNLVCGLNNGTQIHNFGLWDAQTDQQLVTWYNSLYVVFNNYGTFRKSAAVSSTVFGGGVNFTNSGLTDVRRGTFELGDIGSGGGTFSNAPGTTIQFDNGYTFTGGSTLAGAGNYLLNGGPFNLPTSILSSNVLMMGGSLVGPNVLNGRLAWVGGTWRAAGPIVIATNSVLVIGGTSDHDVGNCILTNFGMVAWNTIGGDLACGLNNGTQIHNFGLWDVQTDQRLVTWFNSLYVIFNNYGTFRKSAGVSSTVFDGGVSLTNTGTLDVQTGKVTVDGTCSLTGTLNFGINSATNFGALQLAGAAGFAGTLSVNFNNTTGPYLYPSLVGHSFGVISYPSEVGLFSRTNLPPDSSWWRVNYGSSAVSLIPLPQLPGQGGTVVQATSLWADTYLRVTNGWRVLVTANGSWSWQANQTFGPDGDPNTTTTADLFYSGARHAALIGYLGLDPYQGHWRDGSFFPQPTGYWNIGSNNVFTADRTGELWLGFNDDAVTGGTNDNSGFVTAQISIMPPQPVIQLLTRQGSTLLFAWATIPGQTYQVQYKTDLSQPAWNNLVGPFTATDVSSMASDLIGTDPQRFYRVVQLP
jgi:hypothetical protein